MKNGIHRINAHYDLDLDYTTYIDIDGIELQKIIDKADDIITEKSNDSEKLAMAYLKKAQCMQKLEEIVEHFCFKEELNNILEGIDTVDPQERIKNLIEKALELHPYMPEALMQMGKVYFNMAAAKEGNIDKAIDMYTKAIQLKPDYAAAHNNLGGLYASESYFRYKNDSLHLNKSIDEYTEAIRIRPFDAVYYLNRGIIYSKLKKHEKAIGDFSNALNYGSEEFKNETFIFHLRGQEYTEIGNYVKAIDDFSESLRLRPDYDKSLLMRGNAYLGAGKKDEAKVDLDEYLQKKREWEKIIRVTHE
jgi:tetratricopeptide (TPR) repeat protein